LANSTYADCRDSGPEFGGKLKDVFEAAVGGLQDFGEADTYSDIHISQLWGPSSKQHELNVVPRNPTPLEGGRLNSIELGVRKFTAPPSALPPSKDVPCLRSTPPLDPIVCLRT
jgi:hypothetical protein